MSLEMQRQSRKRDDVVMVVRGDPVQVRGRASSQIGEPRRGCFTAQDVILAHDFEHPALDGGEAAVLVQTAVAAARGIQEIDVFKSLGRIPHP